MSEKRKAYVEKLKAKLDEWNAEIDRLSAKADATGAEARIEYQHQIAKLKEKRADARNRIEKLRQSGEIAWEDLKAGVEKAMDELGNSIKAAASRFK